VFIPGEEILVRAIYRSRQNPKPKRAFTDAAASDFAMGRAPSNDFVDLDRASRSPLRNSYDATCEIRCLDPIRAIRNLLHLPLEGSSISFALANASKHSFRLPSKSNASACTRIASIRAWLSLLARSTDSRVG
jgi:hypothetical protein